MYMYVRTGMRAEAVLGQIVPIGNYLWVHMLEEGKG